jgi:hypothetical protein
MLLRWPEFVAKAFLWLSAKVFFADVEQAGEFDYLLNLAVLGYALKW